MMVASKNSKFIEVVCIESQIFKDDVWGDCSIFKSRKYEMLDEKTCESKYIDETWCLIKINGGLCPYERKYFKLLSEIREDIINKILK